MRLTRHVVQDLATLPVTQLQIFLEVRSANTRKAAGHMKGDLARLNERDQVGLGDVQNLSRFLGGEFG